MKSYKELHSLEAKYAGGGRATNPLIDAQLKTVREAIAHLENGDHAAAHSTLAGNDAAMQHPEIAKIVAAMGQPTTTPPAGMADGGQPDAALDARALASGASTSPSIMGHLTQAMNANPMASGMLKGHAMALLQAHLAAARALHQVTGNVAGYKSYLEHAKQFSEASSSADNHMAQMQILQELAGGAPQAGGGPSPQATAPMAQAAATSAVPRQ